MTAGMTKYVEVNIYIVNPYYVADACQCCEWCTAWERRVGQEMKLL